MLQFGTHLWGPRRENARDTWKEQVLLILLERVDMVWYSENTCARAGLRIHWSCSTVNTCVRRENVFFFLIYSVTQRSVPNCGWSCHHGVASFQVADRGDLKIWTADRGWSTVLGVGRNANNTALKKQKTSRTAVSTIMNFQIPGRGKIS